MSDVATLDAHRTGEMVQPTLFENVAVAYTEVKLRMCKTSTEDTDIARIGEVRRFVVVGEVVGVSHVPLDKGELSGPRVRIETVKAVEVTVSEVQG